MQMQEQWPAIKDLFRQSFQSSFHFSVASVDESGEPHVTPIGSLILGEPGHGIYFDEFPIKLSRNLETNNQICVLAVNSNRWFWLQSLFRGRFTSPPAVRLYGTVGEPRAATEKEVQLWQRRVKRVSSTKGHAIMWANMSTVRDIEFSRMEPVNLGEMTRDTYSYRGDKNATANA